MRQKTKTATERTQKKDKKHVNIALKIGEERHRKFDEIKGKLREDYLVNDTEIAIYLLGAQQEYLSLRDAATADALSQVLDGGTVEELVEAVVAASDEQQL